MSGKRRSTAQRVRDRRKIADLYLQGWIQADIADELTISQQTVSNDLKALHGEWLASALMDFSEAKSQELAKIDRLEREYWQAWERSCEDAESVTQEGTAEGVDKVKKTSKGQAGDPRFLQGVQWCIERRCKILGVDAPEKYAVGGPGDFDPAAWKKRAQERLQHVAKLDEPECADTDT
jgi:predicted transcriptional regulator